LLKLKVGILQQTTKNNADNKNGVDKIVKKDSINGATPSEVQKAAEEAEKEQEKRTFLL
jgi:hypothetical protein